MSTAPDPKTMAKSLRAELRARHQVELTHSQCLELVARQHGLADWNILAARAVAPSTGLPWGAANTTIPVLRIFSVDAACSSTSTSSGSGRLRWPRRRSRNRLLRAGQRAATTLHLTEVRYDPGPGATILIWIEGIVALREELNARREQVRVWGPAVWAPEIEDAPWERGC